jgi:hypothetical protein
MNGAEMAVRAADKAGREINRKSLRAVESQGGTIITIGLKPLPIMTRRLDGWLEAALDIAEVNFPPRLARLMARVAPEEPRGAPLVSPPLSNVEHWLEVPEIEDTPPPSPP